MTNNRERFPDIVLPPKPVTVFGEEFTVYKFRFDGLYNLHRYLTSNPEINTDVFQLNKLSSIRGDVSFAGEPYEQAVEHLINYNDPEYRKFLSFSRQSKVKNLKKGATITSEGSVAGGGFKSWKFATGDPKCYSVTRVKRTDKVVDIYVITNYLGLTTPEQVKHKAIILTNIIHALEQNGLKVNVHAFSASTSGNELIDVDLKIKGYNNATDYQALYRSLCPVEFLRRIIFRVRETSDVKNDWDGYGRSCNERFIKEYLQLGDYDIYFGTPDELGIEGENLGDDCERCLDHIQIAEKINIGKAKIHIKNSFK